jgi:hypothetical protein|tara:strand:- start:603 stop:839 length:237 start_codon:yes stop_codon:yes gene_type:complete
MRDKKGNDPVNRPSHYTQGSVECLDAIKSALGHDGFEEFCRGQVLKYVWRAPHKNANLQDYQKARFYLDKLISLKEDL